MNECCEKKKIPEEMSGKGGIYCRMWKKNFHVKLDNNDTPYCTNIKCPYSPVYVAEWEKLLRYF